VLSVGRLVEQKGFVVLFRACKILKDEGLRFSCRIVGGSVASSMNYYVELKRIRHELGLEAEVELLGARPFTETVGELQEADIFVLPSVIAENGRRDVTPNVILEAMAMQLPVVSTTVAGIPELVEDGVTGLLVPPGDETALAAAILRLAGDPSLRESLGRNGRRAVEERFDIRKNVLGLKEVFVPSCR
jgi:glycosyltransferase involved in cell wall biosynthesis